MELVQLPYPVPATPLIRLVVPVALMDQAIVIKEEVREPAIPLVVKVLLVQVSVLEVIIARV